MNVYQLKERIKERRAAGNVANKNMNYTIKVNVVKTTNEETKVKGFANVVFGGSFKITNISIMENSKTGDLFVSMPRYRSSELGEDGQPIYKDVCNPITKEFREELYKNILTVYGKAVEDPNAEMKFGADSQDSKSEPDFSVRMHPLDKEDSNVKAVGQIYIGDCFIVNNVNIIEGKKGLFVTMPSYKTKRLDDDGKAVYQDVCYPVTKDFRDKLFNAVQDAYATEKDKITERTDNKSKSDTEPSPSVGKNEFLEIDDKKESSKEDSKDNKVQEKKPASKRGKRK